MNFSYYYEWPEFFGVYLEDSYVIDIKECGNTIIFMIEAVLKENHPEYEQPLPGIQYCYKNAEITFVTVSEYRWIARNAINYEDANGNIDYGNIDFFAKKEDKYFLEGDWGELQVKAERVKFTVLHKANKKQHN